MQGIQSGQIPVPDRLIEGGSVLKQATQNDDGGNIPAPNRLVESGGSPKGIG